MEIIGHTGRQIYAEVVQHVLTAGVRRNPRSRETVDAGFVSILLREPIDAFPTGCGRQPRKAIAAVEALQLIAGWADPDLVVRVAPKFRQYMELADSTFHGAYGSRIGHQMSYIVAKLSGDQDTRQAVATLWDPQRDNVQGKLDYPCTVALQFEIENNTLCMNTIMRSNDVWLGLPYDLFQFTQLQMTLANVIGRKPGWYRHTALSMHAYVDDLDNLENVHSPRDDYYDPAGQPRGISAAYWHRAAETAKTLMYGRGDDDDFSQKWYADALESYYIAS